MEYSDWGLLEWNTCGDKEKAEINNEEKVHMITQGDERHKNGVD